MALLFDSNILIDLNGHVSGREAVNRTTDRFVSVITWMEVLAGTRSEEEEVTARTLLRHFEVVPSRNDIAQEHSNTAESPTQTA